MVFFKVNSQYNSSSGIEIIDFNLSFNENFIVKHVRQYVA